MKRACRDRAATARCAAASGSERKCSVTLSTSDNPVHTRQEITALSTPSAPRTRAASFFAAGLSRVAEYPSGCSRISAESLSSPGDRAGAGCPWISSSPVGATLTIGRWTGIGRTRSTTVARLSISTAGSGMVSDRGNLEKRSRPGPRAEKRYGPSLLIQ